MIFIYANYKFWGTLGRVLRPTVTPTASPHYFHVMKSQDSRPLGTTHVTLFLVFELYTLDRQAVAPYKNHW